MTNLPIIDLFTSIQGEGKYAGQPSVFIRVSGCNLRCVFGNSICDTPYSSFNPERGGFTAEDVLNELISHPTVKHIVITGGEPTLYQNEISELLHYLETELPNRLDNEAGMWGYVITIETNGSLDITNEYLVDRIDLWSFSPKLSTAVAKKDTPIHTPNGIVTFNEAQVDSYNRTRKNSANLANIIMSGSDVQLKFVYSGEDSYKEIKDWVAEINELINNQLLQEDCGYTIDVNAYVMLMPEGMTNEVLTMHRREAANICISEGWAYTDRLHITIWGDKRGF